MYISVWFLPLNGGKQTFWEGIKHYEFTECQALTWQIEINFEFTWILCHSYHGAYQQQFGVNFVENECGVLKSEFKNCRLVGYVVFVGRLPFLSKKGWALLRALGPDVPLLWKSGVGTRWVWRQGEPPSAPSGSSVQLGSSPDAAGGRSRCQEKPCSLLLTARKSQLGARVCACVCFVCA